MEEHTDNVYLRQLDTFLKLPRKVQEDMWQDLKGGMIDPKKWILHTILALMNCVKVQLK